MRSRLFDYLPELILLANAGAFALLLAELAIIGHSEGTQLIAPVTAIAGIVLCLVALAIPRRLRVAPAMLLVVLSVSGLIGFAQHLDASGASLPALVAVAHADDDEEDDRRDEEKDEDDDDDPPPLAPLGLSGTALLSAIAAFASPPRQRGG